MSATLIGWIISIVFVIILVAGFFIGFWRGLKRSTVNTVLSLVGVVVAFFITPLITNALLGISVSVDGEVVPLRELAVALLKQNEDAALLMAANPNFKTLARALPGAILNTVVFIVVTVAVEFILYIIYKILAKTVFKYKTGQKKRRALGGVVGLVKTFIIVLLAVMPFASLVGLASSMVGTTATDDNSASAIERTLESQSDETLLSSNVSPEAVEVINGLENNMLIKCCGMFGLDNAMFDYYATVDIDGENVVIREEVSNIYQTANAVYQVQNAVVNGRGIAHFDYDKLSEILNKVVDGGLFKTLISETLGRILTDVEYRDTIDSISIVRENPDVINKIISDLKSTKGATGSYHQYFSDDIKTLFNVFRKVGESGLYDGIISIEEPTVSKVVAYLTNDNNIDTFTTCVLDAFDIKMFRASAKPLTNMALGMILGEIDELGADTNSWTENQWETSAQQIVDAVSLYGDIEESVAFNTILEHPTVLFDKTNSYDIASLTSNIGKFIDTVRVNELFKTSEGESVIENMLEENDLTLPADKVNVLNKDGTISLKEIKTYEELFGFISPALTTLREEGVYDILTGTKPVETLAAKLSESGKEDLLLEIILPLREVNPTKQIISDSLYDSLGDGFIDFNLLSSYMDWKNDLEYISDLLIVLNSKSVNIGGTDKTYLSLVVDQNMEAVVDTILPEEVEKMFNPLFYAKSTHELKLEIIDQIYAMVSEIADSSVSAPSTPFTFEKDNAEDQTYEFVSTTKYLLEVSKTYDGEDIGSVDRTLLGKALDEMKVNAYRTELLDQEQTGVFANAFEAIMTKFKSDYNYEIEIGLPFLEAQGDAEAGIYYDLLTSEHYYAIDFVEFMDYLTQKQEIIDNIPTT